MIKVNPINIRIWSKLGSCGALGIAANELAETDEKIVFLTADLCNYSGLERYSKNHPDRFINLGIAEENMIGVSAGMAKRGFRPYCSTYGTFASMRCADQVRVNMGYMGLNIKLIGLTSGLSVGILGATHISCEDLAVFRSIPGITILSPADSFETIKAIIAANSIDGPCYIRLTGPMNNPIVYNEDYNYEIGKAITLKEGNDVGIIATGTMVYNALQVAEKLKADGIECAVIDMHTIKPLDLNAIDSLKKTKLIVSIEEHSIYGGLGGAIAEYISSKQGFPPLQIMGLADKYPHAASYDYLIEKYGLSVDKIYQRIIEKYKKEILK